MTRQGLPQQVLAIAHPLAQQQRALHRANAMRLALNARVEAHAIIHDPGLDPGIFHWRDEESAADREAQLNATRAWLNDQATSAGWPDCDVSVTWEHPFDKAALALVEGNAPDLVIFQPRDSSGHRLSHAEWRFIRHCPCNIWLARGGPWPQNPRVFAAVDPSHTHDKPADLDRKILALAHGLNAAFGGEFHVVHALGETPGFVEFAQSFNEYEAELQDVFERKIIKLLPAAGKPPDQVHLPAKEPDRALPMLAASPGADMLVIGVLARSRIKDMMIGSTVRDILPRTDCDLLLVRP